MRNILMCRIKPFDWIRGYQVGGKSITWGRACQRWSDFEFTSPARFGYAIDWPIRYKDIAPWYGHVERFAGICGSKDGLEALAGRGLSAAIRNELCGVGHSTKDKSKL